MTDNITTDRGACNVGTGSGASFSSVVGLMVAETVNQIGNCEGKENANRGGENNCRLDSTDSFAIKGPGPRKTISRSPFPSI